MTPPIEYRITDGDDEVPFWLEVREVGRVVWTALPFQTRQEAVRYAMRNGYG